MPKCRARLCEGDTLAVGAPEADVDGKGEQGRVYVFSRDQGGVDQWGLVQELVAGDGLAGDRLGAAVSLAGELLAGLAAYSVCITAIRPTPPRTKV